MENKIIPRQNYEYVSNQAAVYNIYNKKELSFFFYIRSLLLHC